MFWNRDTHARTSSPRFDKSPDDGDMPLLQRHMRNIRFQLAAVNEHKAVIMEHGFGLGSDNEAVAVPNPIADLSGREVMVFRFVGGTTLVEDFYAAYADVQEHMRQKKPDTTELQPSVSHLEWRLDGCDIVGRADPTHRPRPRYRGGQRFARCWREELLHGALPEDPIIEEKSHKKRQQEAEERRSEKQRRESTSAGAEALDSQADCQSQRSQSGYQKAHQFIRTNFDEAIVKFDAFLRMMLARGLRDRYADLMCKDVRSTELQMQSTVVYLANKTNMDTLQQHCRELPDDQFAWVLFATLRPAVPIRDGSPRCANCRTSANSISCACACRPTPRPCGPFRAWHSRRRSQQWHPPRGRAPRAKRRPSQGAVSSGGLSVAPVAAASLVEDRGGHHRGRHDVDVGGAHEQAHVIVRGFRFGRRSVLPREASLASASGFL